MITIGFTGTRSGMTSKQYQMVDGLIQDFLNHHKEIKTRDGDCKGSDEEFNGIVWYYKNAGFNVTIESHPPTNPKLRAFCQADVIHEPKEYKARDRDIVNLSDVLIGCPKEKPLPTWSGTAYTLRYGIDQYEMNRQLGQHKEVIIIWPSGEYDIYPQRNEF